ncbi:MAG: 4a-hydroxytetrahydrobiopterin dehydratase [Gammaproteobacteria bacterium]|nr:4a-hydroxytetrahydrobiopterin dehydratase [Gammaproteobacteria bacterium]
MVQPWKQRKRPARLERRLEFEDYETTREFLDQAAELSEQRGIYPDLSFGRTYVNITLHPEDADSEIPVELEDFAAALDRILEGMDGSSGAPSRLRGVVTPGS